MNSKTEPIVKHKPRVNAFGCDAFRGERHPDECRKQRPTFQELIRSEYRDEYLKHLYAALMAKTEHDAMSASRIAYNKRDAVSATTMPYNERKVSDDKLPYQTAKERVEAKDKPQTTTVGNHIDGEQHCTPIVDNQIDGNCAELPLRGGNGTDAPAQDGTDMVNRPAHYTQGEHDTVNHPSHYCQGGIECIDAIQAAVTGLSGMEAVCVANAIKYVWRSAHKNGNEDINKAMWYLTRLKKVRAEHGKQ